MVEMRKRSGISTEIQNKPDFDRKNAQVKVEKEPVEEEDEGLDGSVDRSKVNEPVIVSGPVSKLVSEKDVVVHFKGNSARVLNQFVIHRSISEGQIVQKSKLVDEAVLFYIKKTEPELYSRLKSEGLIKK